MMAKKEVKSSSKVTTMDEKLTTTTAKSGKSKKSKEVSKGTDSDRTDKKGDFSEEKGDFSEEKVEVDKSTDEETKVAVKRKKRPHESSPMIGNNMMNLKPGENTKFMAINVELLMMEDIDMRDVNQVKNRIAEYFGMYAKYDMKPTVSGLAVALNGHSRQWLWAVANDAPIGARGNKSTLPKESIDCIKKTYKVLETSWENYMNSGKINPVAGIFLGKNNYGYQDKVETVINTNDNSENDYNVREIKERYK